MASIHIQRNHTLGRDGARRAVEDVAAQMRQKLDLTYNWSGDVLYFRRSGAEGQIEVDDRSVTVKVELSGIASMLKGSIEQQIKGFLDQRIR